MIYRADLIVISILTFFDPSEIFHRCWTFNWLVKLMSCNDEWWTLMYLGSIDLTDAVCFARFSKLFDFTTRFFTDAEFWWSEIPEQFWEFISVDFRVSSGTTTPNLLNDSFCSGLAILLNEFVLCKFRFQSHQHNFSWNIHVSRVAVVAI